LYANLIQSELGNPIVSHSFDPIGGKFNREKKANFDKASVVINQLMRNST